MKSSTIASSLALAAAASAQDMSLCDKYTTALLMDNNATNQQTLLTLVVNTAVIGNYTMPNVGIMVPGILANGTGDYEGVSLAKYFDGSLLSTNGGNMGVSQSFLDGGGAAPLMENKPANDTSSAQYTLLTHLYSYFGYLLGCSQFANTTMEYTGSTSMYEVHKFMGLDKAEVGYFIQQVGMSAASFGVSDEDVATVGKALMDTFGYRCSPEAAVPMSAEPALQAICIADDCEISPNATCDAYAAVMEPMPASSSSGMMMPTSSASSSGMMMPTGSASSTPSSGSGMTPTESSMPVMTGAANVIQLVSGPAAVAVGLAAFML